MDKLFELHDDFGQLYVYEDRVVIERKGARASFAHGLKGGKTIPVNSLTNIEFKPAGAITKGYIQFGVLGDVGSKGGFAAASYDENTMFFKKKDSNIAEDIKSFLERKILEKGNGSTIIQTAASAADELKKFKELLDMGVISQEEFDAKKNQLLGL